MKKIFSLLLACLILLPLAFSVSAAPQVTVEGVIPKKDAIYDITLQSEGAFLFNLETGTALYEKNEDIQMFPASTTKIMTCLVVLEACPNPKEETITVSDTGVFRYIIDDGGVHMSLVKGETFTVWDLLLGLMMNSYCDVAELLAYHFGGGDPAVFIEKMNEKAESLGLENTHFENAHGLHHDDHHSSPRDIATFFSAALENPLFREIISTRSYTVPATEKMGKRSLRYSVKCYYDTSPHYRDHFVGGKSGFTDQAGRCLATLSEIDGTSYVCVLLDANDNDTVYKETALLTDYAHENYEIQTVFKKGDEITKVPIPEAETELPVYCEEDVRVLVRKGTEPTWRVEAPESLTIEEAEDGKNIGSLFPSFNGKDAENYIRLLLELDENVPLTTKSEMEKEADKAWESVSGIFKADRVFVILLISLLVLIALCIPAMKITKLLHKKNSHQPKH